jgi:hypothetical protein
MQHAPVGEWRRSLLIAFIELQRSQHDIRLAAQHCNRDCRSPTASRPRACKSCAGTASCARSSAGMRTASSAIKPVRGTGGGVA